MYIGYCDNMKKILKHQYDDEKIEIDVYDKCGMLINDVAFTTTAMRAFSKLTRDQRYEILDQMFKMAMGNK